jgi:hypothetical protein
MLRSHAFYSFSEFGFGILDDMAFIENTVEPIPVLEARDVVADYFVRCDNDVVFLQGRQKSRSIFRVAGV